MTQTEKTKVPHALNTLNKFGTCPIVDGQRGVAHVFIRDLVVEAQIGIHDYEQGWWQPVCININMATQEIKSPEQEKHFEDVVCYETLAERIRVLAVRKHVALVEELAEDIAALCLEDARVLMVRVRVEKPKAIEQATAAGVEIERFSPHPENYSEAEEAPLKSNS
ncbi:MAG: dihydroneopterin aldolase [Parvularculales bacterium]